jgi:nicotinate-nucleotide adenylyltransferase
MSKVVIYSGSFDPLHNGHKAIINELYNKFDKIFIIPVKHKSNMMFNDNMRLKFINQYIKECYSNTNKIFVLDDEINDNDKNELSKTLNLINYIKIKYLNLNDELYLCIGYDQYENLKNWYKYEELLKIIKLVVVNRSESRFEKLYPNLENETTYITIYGYEDVNSIKIREQIYNYVILN